MKNALAICAQGRLGLILSDEPKEISYADGNTGTVWTGIHVIGGKPWSSKKPKIIQYLSDEDAQQLLEQIEASKKDQQQLQNWVTFLRRVEWAMTDTLMSFFNFPYRRHIK